ncbi:MAG: hypothetical protein FWB85_04340 [Chitinispirillia bacterium]|nr:hypothetical protein [Chitinispirillia bacterium]MCL2241570.1 hypothetical protein [Chitinispirillia bacterium]
MQQAKCKSRNPFSKVLAGTLLMVVLGGMAAGAWAQQIINVDISFDTPAKNFSVTPGTAEGSMVWDDRTVAVHNKRLLPDGKMEYHVYVPRAEGEVTFTFNANVASYRRGTAVASIDNGNLVVVEGGTANEVTVNVIENQRVLRFYSDATGNEPVATAAIFTYARSVTQVVGGDDNNNISIKFGTESEIEWSDIKNRQDVTYVAVSEYGDGKNAVVKVTALEAKKIAKVTYGDEVTYLKNNETYTVNFTTAKDYNVKVEFIEPRNAATFTGIEIGGKGFVNGEIPTGNNSYARESGTTFGMYHNSNSNFEVYGPAVKVNETVEFAFEEAGPYYYQIGTGSVTKAEVEANVPFSVALSAIGYGNSVKIYADNPAIPVYGDMVEPVADFTFYQTAMTQVSVNGILGQNSVTVQFSEAYTQSNNKGPEAVTAGNARIEFLDKAGVNGTNHAGDLMTVTVTRAVGQASNIDVDGAVESVDHNGNTSTYKIRTTEPKLYSVAVTFGALPTFTSVKHGEEPAIGENLAAGGFDKSVDASIGMYRCNPATDGCDGYELYMTEGLETFEFAFANAGFLNCAVNTADAFGSCGVEGGVISASAINGGDILTFTAGTERTPVAEFKVILAVRMQVEVEGNVSGENVVVAFGSTENERNNNTFAFPTQDNQANPAQKAFSSSSTKQHVEYMDVAKSSMKITIEGLDGGRTVDVLGVSGIGKENNVYTVPLGTTAGTRDVKVTFGNTTIVAAGITGKTEDVKVAPVAGATPVVGTDLAEYAQFNISNSITWAGTLADNKFDYETVYTATVVLTAKHGFVFGNVDGFTVKGGETITGELSQNNTVLTLTVEFPITGLPPPSFVKVGQDEGFIFADAASADGFVGIKTAKTPNVNVGLYRCAAANEITGCEFGAQEYGYQLMVGGAANDLKFNFTGEVGALKYAVGDGQKTTYNENAAISGLKHHDIVSFYNGNDANPFVSFLIIEAVRTQVTISGVSGNDAVTLNFASYVNNNYTGAFTYGSTFSHGNTHIEFVDLAARFDDSEDNSKLTITATPANNRIVTVTQGDDLLPVDANNKSEILVYDHNVAVDVAFSAAPVFAGVTYAAEGEVKITSVSGAMSKNKDASVGLWTCAVAGEAPCLTADNVPYKYQLMVAGDGNVKFDFGSAAQVRYLVDDVAKGVLPEDGIAAGNVAQVIRFVAGSKDVDLGKFYMFKAAKSVVTVVGAEGTEKATLTYFSNVVSDAGKETTFEQGNGDPLVVFTDIASGKTSKLTIVATPNAGRFVSFEGYDNQTNFEDAITYNVTVKFQAAPTFKSVSFGTDTQPITDSTANAIAGNKTAKNPDATVALYKCASGNALSGCAFENNEEYGYQLMVGGAANALKFAFDGYTEELRYSVLNNANRQNQPYTAGSAIGFAHHDIVTFATGSDNTPIASFLIIEAVKVTVTVDGAVGNEAATLTFNSNVVSESIGARVIPVTGSHIEFVDVARTEFDLSTMTITTNVNPDNGRKVTIAPEGPYAFTERGKLDVTVTFAPVLYTVDVTVANDVGGTLTATVDGVEVNGPVAHGADVLFTAAPESNRWVVKGWKVNGNAVDETVLTRTVLAQNIGSGVEVEFEGFVPTITIGTDLAPSPIALTVGEITEANKLTIAASVDVDDETLTYQWYSAASADAAGTAIAGATTATFQIPVASVKGDYYYYCIVSGAADIESVKSNVATVNVILPELTGSVAIGTALDWQVEQTVTAVLTDAPANASYTYLWETCDAVDADECDEVGGNTSTYTIVTADVGKYLRVTVTAPATHSGEIVVTSSSAIIPVSGPITWDDNGVDFTGAAGNVVVTIVDGATGTMNVPSDLRVTIKGDAVLDNTITLDIPANETVVWEASVTADLDGNHPLVNLAGSGTLRVTGGKIVNSGTAPAISESGANQYLVIEGGKIEASNATYAIMGIHVTIKGGEIKGNLGVPNNPTAKIVFDIATGTYDDFDGTITEGTQGTIEKSGAGNLVLKGNGTVGAVTVSAGTLTIGTGVQFTNNGMLTNNGEIVVNGTLVQNGNVAGGDAGDVSGNFPAGAAFAAEVTDVTVNNATLSSTGGEVVVTVTGLRLRDDIQVGAYIGNAAAPAFNAVAAAGTAKSQTATLTFPSATVNDVAYTVKTNVAGAAATAAVTVSANPLAAFVQAKMANADSIWVIIGNGNKTAGDNICGVGTPCGQSNVKLGLNLPTTMDNVAISWTSSNTSVITVDADIERGIVHVPTSGGDVEVKLTATLSIGATTYAGTAPSIDLTVPMVAGTVLQTIVAAEIDEVLDVSAPSASSAIIQALGLTAPISSSDADAQAATVTAALTGVSPSDAGTLVPAVGAFNGDAATRINVVNAVADVLTNPSAYPVAGVLTGALSLKTSTTAVAGLPNNAGLVWNATMLNQGASGGSVTVNAAGNVSVTRPAAGSDPLVVVLTMSVNPSYPFVYVVSPLAAPSVVTPGTGGSTTPITGTVSIEVHHFNYDLSSKSYTGGPLPAPVTSIFHDLMGTITVLYNGSPNAPVNVGTYAVGVSVSGGTFFAPGTITLGNYNITRSAVVSVAEGEKVIPGGDVGEGAVVVPVKGLSAVFTAGPNPVLRAAGAVSFFWQGKALAGGTLSVYDAQGNLVKKVSISDAGAGTARRAVGAWDLTDAKGRAVSEGTYLVRGEVRAQDGGKERVSCKLGVR